jgi:surface antigen
MNPTSDAFDRRLGEIAQQLRENEALKHAAEEALATRNAKAAEALATEALKYDESLLWKNKVDRSYLKAGQNKCNLFFGEVAAKLGLSVPKFDNEQYWDTKTWYDNKKNSETLKCWSLTNSPKRGDIFVFHDGTFGHMGVVTNPASMRAVSAMKTKVDEIQQWAMHNGEPRRIWSQADLKTIDTAPRVYFLEYTCPDMQVDPRTSITP